MVEGPTEREFVVVVRAQSNVAVRREDPLLVLRNFPLVTGDGRAKLTVQTRHDTKTFGIPVHRELLIEARGPAASLEDTRGFGETASAIVPALAFVANAPIGQTTPFVAYEVTAGVDEREFVQEFRHELTDMGGGIPFRSRGLRVELAGAFIMAVLRNPEGDRIRRALMQYWLALAQWQPHRRLLALSHLFMGAEALAVAALRNYQRATGTSDEDLVAQWEVQHGRNQGFRRGDLIAAARLHLVFHGDARCHSTAREASDRFEHGYTSLGDAQSLADEVSNETAKHLRRAIVELSGIDEASATELLSPPLDTPFESWGLVRKLQGRIVGSSDQDPTGGDADSPYPHYVWTPSAALALDAENEQRVTMSDNFRASIGAGLQFRNDRFAVYASDDDARNLDITAKSVDEDEPDHDREG